MIIKFGDLSIPLKVLVIFGWAMFGIVGFSMIIGFVQEMLYLT